jgi:hypothetical protein
MTILRRIKPLEFDDLTPNEPVTALPRFELVDPLVLFVDETYQRSVSERGRRQIRKIVKEFCWTRFKPPICCHSEVDNKTVLLVIDGQHTAIAAASNPNVRSIPVMIVEAPETAAQAAAFVGQNTDRTAVTPLHIFQAALIAGDEDALTTKQVCERAGVKILKSPAGTSRYGACETIAVTAIQSLVRRHTAMGARRILEVLVNAQLAPITGHHIRAAEYLMVDKDHCHRFEAADLSTAIGELFLLAEDEAKILSHAHRMPFWRALAAIWFRKTKKKRMHLRIAA